MMKGLTAIKQQEYSRADVITGSVRLMASLRSQCSVLFCTEKTKIVEGGEGVRCIIHNSITLKFISS